MWLSLGPQVFDTLFTLIWISISLSAAATQEKNMEYQKDKLQSDADSAAFYKFPNPYCKHVGQFLPHPTNKCVYLRCDYGTEHWLGKEGSLPLFTIEQACPPGVSVNRTTFYYARYRIKAKGEEDDLDLDPNDPYNFPVSPCTIVDPDCALVIPSSPEPEKSKSKPPRTRHRPRFRQAQPPKQRHKPKTQQPVTDDNGFIRPEDLPDSPGNPYRR